MRATVVIASLNEGECLWRTVGSCLETTAGLDCEVLVADDGSSDGSIDDLRGRFPRIRAVAHETRRGVASTKHLGAQNATGDVIVFLDGHCKPEPGALARLVDAVEELDGRAVVTPAVPALDTRTWQNKLDQTGHGYRIDLLEFRCDWSDRTVLRPRGRFLESQALIGCCLAVSHDLYEELRGFDTGMSQWGSEDIDFGLKAWLMGSAVLNEPDAIVGHRFRASFDNFQVTAAHVLVNQMRMAWKNFDDPAWQQWLSRCRDRHASRPALWAEAERTFEQGRDSADRERAYLLEHRTRDEYWFADYFDLSWPSRNSPRVGPG